MRLVALVILILSALTTLSSQYDPDSVAYDFVFHMPGGWKRLDQANGGTMLVAPLTAPSAAFVVLFPPIEIKTNLQATFNEQWQGLQQQYRVLQGGRITPQHFQKGYDALETYAVLADQRGQSWTLFLVVAQNGTRAETLVYLSNVGGSVAQTLLELVQHVIDSVGFANGTVDPRAGEAGKPVEVPKGKGSLSGMYRGLSPIVFTGNKYKVGFVYNAFFPDGRFRNGIVDQGLDNLDEDADVQRNPGGWANYDRAAGKIVFPITGPAPQKGLTIWDLKEYPDHIEVDGAKFTLLDGCDGLRLAGAFRREGYQQLYGEGQKGIAFTPDGHFVDEGAFRAAGGLVHRPVGTATDFDDGRPGRAPTVSITTQSN
jgi:hypothetical protein